MRVVLLFIDGVGIGRADPAHNPLARAPYLLSRFDDGTAAPLPEGGHAVGIDATFGVPGRPQSASNQTAILTGLPAPRMTGRHVLGFPDAPLRKLLLRHSIVRQMVDAGRTATFANAYPAGYLDALGLPRRAAKAPEVVIAPRALRRLRPSATTLSMAAAAVPLRTLDDARCGQALTNDIDGRRACARGFPVPARTASEAAHILWSLTEQAQFVLFEHYLADEAGHAQDPLAAEAALSTFDAFARQVVVNRPPDAHVLLCSDHGNVEDLSTRSHTLNRVPVLYFGPTPKAVLPHLVAFVDVGRVTLKLLGVEPSSAEGA
jgi:2,3-bisphosphoglycerate-independent phosphoglycerate mutase